MPGRNKLLSAPPYAVEQSLKKLGANLRIARIRRNMTIADVAERIGTGPRAVMDAEKGKGSTGIAVYTALLWLYDLLEDFAQASEPTKDSHGMALALAREGVRARKSAASDNDF